MTVATRGTRTLNYAKPDAEPAVPLRWVLAVTAVWAAVTLLERAAVWAILIDISRSRPFELALRDVVDHVLPPLIAVTLLFLACRDDDRNGRSKARVPFSVLALCGLASLLAFVSIAMWTLQVLPTVRGGAGGVADAVVWEAELVLWRLLPVAWPTAVVAFAVFGLPTRRGAAVAYMVVTMVTLTCAAAATAALMKSRGAAAFNSDVWGYTVLPVWTPLLSVAAIVGGIVIVLALPRLHSVIAIAIAAGAWLTAAALKAWHDERLIGLAQRADWRSLRVSNFPEIGAELIGTMVLWQIAPLVLLFFAALAFAKTRREV